MQLLLEEVRVALTTNPSPPSNGSETAPSFFLPHTDQHPLAGEDEKLLAMSQVLDARDKYTAGHGRRVSVYAERLAKRLLDREDEIDNIRIAGMLHDIGKAAFSDRVFTGEAVTQSNEIHEEIQNHPWTGRTILETFNFPVPVLEYVYYHHERVDGKGYPCGLRDGEIPAGAQIISVADCFDAMTTDRPYQHRKSLAEAIITLNQISGKMLSPQFVAVFIEDIRAHGIITEQSVTA